MGGPGGFGRGGRGRGPTDEEREAERKRKMEERKCLISFSNHDCQIFQSFGSLLTGCLTLLAAVFREEKIRGWTDPSWP